MVASKRPSGRGFFINEMTKLTTTASDVRVNVDLGSGCEGAFFSLATALLDGMISSKNQEMIQKFLTFHFVNFPKHRFDPESLLMTPVDSLRQIINKIPLPTVIQTFAWTLRQIATDESLRAPMRYRNVFKKNVSSLEEESYIAAVAYALNIPIQIEISESGKEMPRRLSYNKAVQPKFSQAFSLMIYRNDINYSLYLTSLFIDQVMAARSALLFGNNNGEENKQVSSIKTIDDVIAKGDAQVILQSSIIYDRLMTMVDMGDLTKKDLLGMYIVSLGTSNQTPYIGLEHGCQSFYNAIEKTTLQQKNRDKTSGDYNQYVVDVLIRGISSAISLGLMNEQDVFSFLDKEHPLHSTC